MKKLVESILNHWLLYFILTLILILIVVDVYEHSSKEFNDTRFNNIVTPIAALLSVVLFFLLTLKQNSLSTSQNLKYNFEKQLENIKDNFKKSFNGGLNCFEIQEQLFSLAFVKNDPDFLTDYNAIRNGHPEPQQYYEGRIYYQQINGIVNYLNTGLPHFHPTIKLLNDIKTSEMLESDLDYVRQRIQSELIAGYLFAHPFVIQFGGHVPVIYVENGSGQASYYKNTAVFKHYEEIQKALNN